MLKKQILFGLVALSVANASTVTLTVNTNTDTSLPGGQTDSSGATTGDLRYCINYILNEQAQGLDQDYAIVFASGIDSIQLRAKLSMLNLLGDNTIVIGNSDPTSPVTITGGSSTGGLFIRQGTVTLQNLNFESCNATGGNGMDGGGGGMGAGGALFIDQAFVTLNNVNFTSCSATAGLGAATTGSGGGGGGLGGNGGSNNGGGGGYCGNGGSSGGGGGGAGGNGGSNYGGGGGAILGTTGGSGGGSPTNAVTVSPNTLSGPATPFVVGGGGYGSQSNGLGGTGAGGNNAGGLGGIDGSTNLGGNGGNGGSPSPANGGMGSSSTSSPGFSGDNGVEGGIGGDGGTYYTGSSSAGSGGGGGGGYSGGGGGGGSGSFTGSTYGGGGGGAGGFGGGGGGGFGANGGAGYPGIGGHGGDGSIGGGGGGGGNGGGGGGAGYGDNGIGNGGNGGEGGGGGGNGASTGGTGGYGAGGATGGGGGFGGGGGNNSDTGGFGGGGGNSFSNGGFGGGGGSNGNSGTGATSSSSTQGGNGAALGGAVFVGSVNGQPTLTLTGNCTTSLNSTSNNSGGGFAGGNDFFLYSGTTLNLMPSTDQTISISQSIIDDSVQSIPMSANWQAGNGTGSNLQVTGTGTVILGGTNSYIGTTIVTSGTLDLNGTLYAGGAGTDSQVTVIQGAILKGIGTINAPTTVSGTLSPGNSIGTMHYTAPLTLSGLLSIEIAPTSGDNSQISSTSTVDITGGTIQIVPDPGTYTIGAQYTLLTSAGLTGTPSLLMPPQFLGELSYPNNSILLTLLGVPPVPISQLQLDDLTGNSRKLAKYLNALATALGVPFETLVNLSEKDQAAALLTLSPSRAAFPRYDNIQAALSFSRLVAQHFASERVLGEMSNPSDNSLALLAAADDDNSHLYGGGIRHVGNKPYDVWISGFGSFLHEKANHQNPAFHATNGGVLVAADRTFDDNGIVGGGLAYSTSHIHESHHFGRAHTQGGLATLYGTWYYSDFFLDASLWGGYFHTNNRRNIFYPGFSATATSHYNSAEANGHLEFGYDWNWGQGSQGTLEPFLACDFIGNWQMNYKEHGAAPYNMHIKSNFASLLQTEAGFNGYYSTTFTDWTFILRGKISYVNQVPFHQRALRANLVGVGDSLGLITSLRTQNLVSPALEIYWKHQSGVFFSAGYNGQFGKWFRNNEVEGKLGYSF